MSVPAHAKCCSLGFFVRARRMPPAIPALVAANGAYVRVGYVMAHLAIFHLMLEPDYRFGKPVNCVIALFQQMQHKAHGSLRPDAGQRGKLINGLFKQGRWISSVHLSLFFCKFSNFGNNGINAGHIFSPPATGKAGYPEKEKRRPNRFNLRLESELGDSNARPLRPERSALPTALNSAFLKFDCKSNAFINAMQQYGGLFFKKE